MQFAALLPEAHSHIFQNWLFLGGRKQLPGMKMFLVRMLCVLAALSAAVANALPPPLPMAITIVGTVPDHGPEHGHIRELIESLERDNWIKLVDTSFTVTVPQRIECLEKGKDATGCLRLLLQNFLIPGANPAAHVILLLKDATHQPQITCIGNGATPSNPASQSRQVDIKTALFAAPAERHPHRMALVSCLMAAQSER